MQCEKWSARVRLGGVLTANSMELVAETGSTESTETHFTVATDPQDLLKRPCMPPFARPSWTSVKHQQ